MRHLLLLAFLLAGCTTIRVEPLALLEGQTEAMAFHRVGEQRTNAGKVSVIGLPEILARATWIDNRIIHKGGLWLEFAGGREVFILYGFESVFVTGVPGRFEVRKEDLNQYREIVSRIQREANGIR